MSNLARCLIFPSGLRRPSCHWPSCAASCRRPSSSSRLYERWSVPVVAVRRRSRTRITFVSQQCDERAARCDEIPLTRRHRLCPIAAIFCVLLERGGQSTQVATSQMRRQAVHAHAVRTIRHQRDRWRRRESFPQADVEGDLDDASRDRASESAVFVIALTESAGPLRDSLS